MKAKKAVTVFLLLFVVVSAAYLLVDAFRPHGTNQAPSAPELATSVDATAKQSSHSTKPAETNHQVVAYYFHGTQRCKTCLAIERLAHEALADGFAPELDSGELTWRVLNTDELPNAHFVEDYALVTSSLVLVNLRDGVQQSWVKLDEVWDLVHDEPAFNRYVVKLTRARLEL